MLPFCVDAEVLVCLAVSDKDSLVGLQQGYNKELVLNNA